MSKYAMILKGSVIGIVHDQDKAPVWPPDPEGNPVRAVLCDNTVKIGMDYNEELGEFSVHEPSPIPVSQLGRIEAMLLDLTGETLSAGVILGAIQEGVNEV